MTFSSRTSSAAVIVFLVLGSPAFAQGPYSGPDDPKTIEAAEQAMQSLGPERGAKKIEGKVIDILGLRSVRVTGSSASIEQTLKDLGAKQVGQEIQISLAGDVLFDFDKWSIKHEAEQSLERVAHLINELKKRRVIVEGHTDSKGLDQYNLKLSQRRAHSVKDWLVEHGNLPEQVRFEVKGYGESKPVAPNSLSDGSDNPEGRAKNRRVEIRLGN